MARGPKWTPEQVATLVKHYPTVSGPVLADMLGMRLQSVYNKAWLMGLKKTSATIARLAFEAIQKPSHPARATQFQAGLTPWNKGLEWTAGGRSAETRFKAGEMRGAAQHNYVPIGTLRTSKDGYLERKMNDTHPVPTRRWEAVHRLVWKAANGPIPKGNIVVFRPGMRTAVESEITADRLECITRGEHAKRNHPRSKNPELGKLVQLKGAITRQVNRIAKEHAERTQ